MKCLIIEDEAPARSLLEAYLAKIPQVALVGSHASAAEASNDIPKADLLLLDIQMPGLTGLQLLRILPAGNRPMAILTTAYSQHALEGFDLDVVDYLLKPIPFERFEKAVMKAYHLWQGRQQPATAKTHIWLKSDGRLVQVKFNEVLYIEGLKEYVSFYTIDKQRIITLASLSKLEEELPTQDFVRVHKSYIANLRQVKAIEGNMLLMQNQQHVPIGRSYKENVLERIPTM